MYSQGPSSSWEPPVGILQVVQPTLGTALPHILLCSFIFFPGGALFEIAAAPAIFDRIYGIVFMLGNYSFY